MHFTGLSPLGYCHPCWVRRSKSGLGPQVPAAGTAPPTTWRPVRSSLPFPWLLPYPSSSPQGLQHLVLKGHPIFCQLPCGWLLSVQGQGPGGLLHLPGYLPDSNLIFFWVDLQFFLEEGKMPQLEQPFYLKQFQHTWLSYVQLFYLIKREDCFV